jgi:predicted component of type VI protein secretion system
MSVLRLIPLKGEAIVVDADEALVGREANCNVVVSHPSVSRRHALIKRKQDVFFVVDQGSANGTFVDSKRIVDATLKDGAVLRFGSASFKVEVRDELPVESIAEDELVVAQTMVGHIGQQSFSATVLEGSTLPDDMPTPHYGTDMRQVREEIQAPTVQSPAINPPALKPPVPRPEPRPEPSRAPRAAPPPSPSASIPPTPAAASNRGPTFWLMVAASALALLFVGAALGLAAAFLARRMGWL